MPASYGPTRRQSNGVLAVVAIVIVFAIALAFYTYIAQRDNCENAGGHLKRLSRDFVCVSNDGRIIGLPVTGGRTWA